MSTPKLSILTAVHNIPDDLLRLSLTSTLGQSERDLELIVVADSTTDANMATVLEFAEKDSRLVVINNKHNLGYGRTMNLALASARGDYIGIVDGDDSVDLTFYEVLLHKASEARYPVVKGNVLVMKDGVMMRALDICEKVKKRHYTFSWQHWSAIYGRQFLQENGILWFPDVSKNEETPFLTRVGVHCDYIPTVPTVYYNYTRREGSLDSEYLSEKKMYDSAKARRKSIEIVIGASSVISNEHLAWVIFDALDRTLIESSRADSDEAFEAAAKGFVSLVQAADHAPPTARYKDYLPDYGFDVSLIRDYTYILGYMKGLNYVPPAVG